MKKYSFLNDYAEGGHPEILKRLGVFNTDQEAGYGLDNICLQAARRIRKAVANPDAGVHFVSGGTQANVVVLDALLRPYESVIAARTAHIHVHEAGAIEATGHKINIVDTCNGKLVPAAISAVVADHHSEHMVKPRAVFVANATELGTVYTLEELAALAEICRKNGLFLYMDGARLGAAVVSRFSDLDLRDLTRLVDIYYIGGTKNGALIGEAVVINNQQLNENFRFTLKQHGALLAKSRFLGMQFLTLFEQDLFLELARHANAMAARLAEGISSLGYEFKVRPETNQIFPVMPKKIIAALQAQYDFSVWEPADPQCDVVRLVTSWATPIDRVATFLKDLKSMGRRLYG